MIDTHIDTVKGLAIDSVGNNIYWSDAALGTLQVAHRDGKYMKTLYTDLDHPSELVINTNHGIGFVLLASFPPKVLQFQLTGHGDPIEVLTNDLRSPKSLSLDYKSSLLFWIDSEKYTIESFNYGSGER